MSDTKTPDRLRTSTTAVSVAMLTAVLDPLLAEIRALRARDASAAEHLAGVLQRLDKHYARATSTDELLADVERRLVAIEKAITR